MLRRNAFVTAHVLVVRRQAVVSLLCAWPFANVEPVGPALFCCSRPRTVNGIVFADGLQMLIFVLVCVECTVDGFSDVGQW